MSRRSVVAVHASVICIIFATLASAVAGEVSVERGLRVSIIAGCHECHTEGYVLNKGKIDPAKAMKGSSIGFQGPWGTSYAGNLRLSAAKLSEDAFAQFYGAGGEFAPPMPYYKLLLMEKDDLRSLHRYLKSLGEPGEATPSFVPPGGRVKTSYIVLAPPQPPPPCTRDFDCGVGEICGKAEPRQCVKR